MTKLELLTLLLPIQALLNTGNIDEAKELIAEVIKEAKIKDSDKNLQSKSERGAADLPPLPHNFEPFRSLATENGTKNENTTSIQQAIFSI